MTPRAWLVIAKDGFEAVFLQRPAAERYAVACHGIIMPLYSEVGGPPLEWPKLVP